MRPTLLRVIIAAVTLSVGVFVGSLHRHLQRTPAVQPVTPVAAPQATPEVAAAEHADYPSDYSTGPWDIAAFIDEYPAAKLERLWRRLEINPDPHSDHNFGDTCSYCEARIYQYNLDADADREIVLQIDDHLAETYRYLIFKESTQHDETILLGHIDVWAKYTPDDPVVLTSNGRSWLIVQSTALTGSGVGAWLDTVYDVSGGIVTPVASYLARGSQNGDLGYPQKVFIGTPTSCEVRNREVVLTVAYRVEYTGYLDHDVALFTTEKKAVLVGSFIDGSTRLDVAHSAITRHEFETIYNLDSMTREDFLRYNRAELNAIASGRDAEKKEWLKEFLRNVRQG